VVVEEISREGSRLSKRSLRSGNKVGPETFREGSQRSKKSLSSGYKVEPETAREAPTNQRSLRSGSDEVKSADIGKA